MRKKGRRGSLLLRKEGFLPKRSGKGDKKKKGDLLRGGGKRKERGKGETILPSIVYAKKGSPN